MEVYVIKPTPGEKKKLRVAAYCRVSSDHDEQLNSAENQRSYYEDYINKHPDYELYDIYCDQGISGRKENRPEFQRMLKDARAGKIDLILTKSISRFARNTSVMIKSIRELKELGIGVYFELQDMNTLNMDGELLLSIYAAFAQAESENIGELLKLAHLRRVEKGDHTACLSYIFGYSKTAEGVIEPDDDALWVRYMFELAAEGYGTTDIARELNRLGVKPKTTTVFTGTVVRKIVKNRTYLGEIVRLHYCEDEDGKIRVNDGTHPPLVIKNNHPAIIDEETWNRASKGLGPSRKEKYEQRWLVSREVLKAECLKYKGRLYCAECGYIMHGSPSKKENAVYFHCYGHSYYGKDFCSVNTIPLEAVKGFGDFEGKIYVSIEQADNKRKYGYESEAEWLNHHQKKPPLVFERDMETAYLEGHLYCKKCGCPLLRRAMSHHRNQWICSGNKAGQCDGLFVPDIFIKRLKADEEKNYIEEVSLNGERSYLYSSEYGKGKIL